MTKNNFIKEEPKAEKIENKRIFHKSFVNNDPYHWLRADNWQEVLQNPHELPQNIRKHLEKENEYFDAFLQDEEEFQENLFIEMKNRLKEDDSSIPEKDGPFYYGYAFQKEKQYPDFYRSLTFVGEKKFYFDTNKEAKDQDYFQLGAIIQSPNHKKFLFSYDNKGAEFYQWRVRDFETGHEVESQVKNSNPNAVWDRESTGFFYIRLDKNHRPSKVFYHKLETKEEDDVLIYEEKDSQYFVSLHSSKLNDYLFINVHDHETSEVWILDLKNKSFLEKNSLICVKKREKSVEYSLIEADNIFYILTNKDGTEDFQIMQTSTQNLSEENWETVIEHQKGRIILGVDAYKNHLLWLERINGLPRILIMDRTTQQKHIIAFEEEAYSLSLVGAREYDSPSIRFRYSSLTTPQQLFDYNLTTHERILLKTQEIPSGHNPSQYITKRLFAKADDGETIPISLYYHKETKIDGSAPCFLYGYGAYGSSTSAQFNTNSLSLVNRGFIYAIAHIRGGKEKGTFWYENGKYKHKKNSFTDFITVGRYLVSQNYTNHQKLVAYGGSAGGMLMGAIANLAPKDFKIIVALVPFVDVLNTMLDNTLPLTPPEWPEWGNPLKSKEDYALIASYSPYDNVAKQDYPNILAMAGLTDPRVTYWEAAKWVSKLRDFKTSKAPVFLKTNMDSGHGGASGRFTKLKEIALIYTYILKIIG